MKKTFTAWLAALAILCMSSLGFAQTLNPATGDNNNMTLILIIGAAAVVVCGILLFLLSRKKKDGGDK